MWSSVVTVNIWGTDFTVHWISHGCRVVKVAYETGYYSTVFQPKDGGAGLIHMIPNNWPYNGIWAQF